MSDLNQIINTSVDEVVDEYTNDEYAYLALTSKIERPFQSKLAYRLHNELSHFNYYVSREWKRFDIAILEQNNDDTFAPHTLIEIKNMYSFDALKLKRNHEKLNGFLPRLEKEQDKFISTQIPDANFIQLLLITHAKNKVPKYLKNVVKYSTFGVRINSLQFIRKST